MASVNYIKDNIQRDLELYQFINDLSDGYDGITRRKDKYLPKQLSEVNDNRVYDLRHKLACYLDSFNPTIDGINGLVFQKPISLETNQAFIEDFWAEATTKKKNFNFFIKKYFKSALKKGRTYAYVDIPKGNAEAKTDTQRQQLGIKPFVVLIKPDNIINYKTEIINGKEVLAMVVIVETIEKDIDEWKTETKAQYRVLTIGQVRVYNQDLIMIEDEATGLDSIPLVELNLDEDKEMFEAKPPFLDIGRLNIDTYQLMSDSRWSANTASIPLLTFLGFDAEEVKAVQISINNAVRSSNDSASVSYLDYEGKGVKLNLELMEVINRKIAEIGMNVLVAGQTEVTATEKTIDTIQTQSKLYNWVDSLKDSLYQILEYVAMYYNQSLDANIDIQADILTQPLTSQEVVAYLNLADKNKITTETLLNLLKDRKVLKEDFDVESELDKLKDENTPFNSMEIND